METNFFNIVKSRTTIILKDNFWDNYIETDMNTTLDGLVVLLNNWEARIDEEHKKPYVTDIVENTLTAFTAICAVDIANNYEEVIRAASDKIIRLLEHRHIGYGFYISIHQTKTFMDSNKNYKKILYQAMVKYFDLYYGRFSDNEQAIEMICKNYEDYMEIKPELLVSALSTHIKNAGTPNDTGYAFHGIELIRTWIDKLPQDIIIEILKAYVEYYLYNDVYRNQIYTIIINSSKIIEKEEYKFFILDSVYIMQMVNSWFKYVLDEPDINVVATENMKWYENSILLFQTKNNIFAYWFYENYRNRKIIIENNTLLELSLSDNNKEIELTINGITKTFQFDCNNWMLNLYQKRETQEELNQFLEENFRQKEYLESMLLREVKYKDSSKELLNHNQILFSHLWLDQYHGISKQQISFDECYTVNDKEEKLVVNKNEEATIPAGFFGEQIYSVMGIVGKNGTGKTSVIHFLQTRFYQLLFMIDHGHIQIKNNRVEDNIVIPKEVKYFVAFKFGKRNFYITNCTCDITDDTLEPFLPNKLSDIYKNYGKTIYFSNMIDTDVCEMLEEENIDSRLRFEFSKAEIEAYAYQKEILKDINNSWCINYSEHKQFRNKLLSYMNFKNTEKDLSLNNNKSGQPKATPVMINRDFIRILCFLIHVTDKDFKRYFGNQLSKYDIKFLLDGEVINLDADKVKDIDINNKSDRTDKTGRTYKTDRTDENNNTEVMLDEEYIIDLIGKIIWTPEPVRVRQLSSGQYAKLAFLSRLYWCFHGFEQNKKFLKEADNLFSMSEIVLSYEACVIFIDEGELYYHPEWQRNFMSTLYEMISKYTAGKNILVQIVVTTNSPFIISDIPKAGVMYLPKENTKNIASTFGSNIHSMLQHNLYMESTIGEFARNKIKEIANRLDTLLTEKKNLNNRSMPSEQHNLQEGQPYNLHLYNQKTVIHNEEVSANQKTDKDIIKEKEKLRKEIALIGDSLIRNQLQKRFDEVYFCNTNIYSNLLLNLNQMKEEKIVLNEDEIKLLKNSLEIVLGTLEPKEEEI